MTTPKLATCLGAMCVLALPFALPALCQTRDEVERRTDNYLNALVEQDRFSGAVLLARDGEIVLSKGYGLADRVSGQPNTSGTKFRIASITKQFTAVAILMLQERGKLRLQDSVCAHLAPCPERWRPVTIHHLLTHTSGIPDHTRLPDYAAVKARRTTPAEIIDRVRDLPLAFPPGADYEYGNADYALLGAIIEQVSGEAYATFVQEHIFAASGMRDTGVAVGVRISAGSASGYRLGPEGVIPAAPVDPSVLFAAGDMYSTVRDLYLWDRALHAGRLITQASLQRLSRPEKDGYAYGIMVRERYGLTLLAHDGSIDGYSAYFTRIPSEDSTIIVLSNLETANTWEIADRLIPVVLYERLVLPAPSTKGKVAFTLRGHDNALIVTLAGSFNGWSDLANRCARERAAWTCRIDLAPGSYQYKFVVDGEWIVDPANPRALRDERGNRNSLIIVED
jgi:CubicO group peptidase (beta-lactamase class C family)